MGHFIFMPSDGTVDQFVPCLGRSPSAAMGCFEREDRINSEPAKHLSRGKTY